MKATDMAGFLNAVITCGPNEGKTVGECIAENIVFGSAFIMTQHVDGEIVRESVPLDEVKEANGR